MRKPSYIVSLIEQGESQTLDFKFNISDSKKIAKSLVAFVNTEGGTLLVGVRDNGSIAGIVSDEELYMLEAAANFILSLKFSWKLKFGVKIIKISWRLKYSHQL